MNNCLNCNKETNNPKFCSHACSASFNCKGKKHSEEQKANISIGINKHIEKIGREEFSKRQRDRVLQRRIFNISDKSNEKRIKTLKETNERKKEELIKNTNFEDLPFLYIKRLLFEERGNKCQECGFEYSDPESGKGIR